MYKYVFIVFFIFFSTNCIAQQKKIPDGYTLITLDGEDAYMNFDTGDIIRTVPLKSSQNYVYNTDDYKNTSSFHIVKKGETLYGISRMYNISLQDIYKLNNKSTDKIIVGEKIIIQDKNNSTRSNFSSKTDYHVVKKGETLYQLSRKYGMSVAKLMSLNNLSSNNIYVGQKIRLK